MLICCNAKTHRLRRATVWDVHGKGFDPAKDNQQPFFGDTPQEDRDTLRRWAHNLRVMLDAGIDPMQRMIDRCREAEHQPLGERPHERRARCAPAEIAAPQPVLDGASRVLALSRPLQGWNDRCLNYGLKPVRDHIMALIREVCDRYDMDGLEFDWNRFPLHFREGEEIEQGKVLTEWLVEVREVVRAAEKKWKHPIWLAARVPARPEVSLGIGLDAVTWAKRGLDRPFDRRAVLGDDRFRYPRGTVDASSQRDRGRRDRRAGDPRAAVSWAAGACQHARARRRRGHGRPGPRFPGDLPVQLLRCRQPDALSAARRCDSVETLADKDRSYVVTYVDINIPGKPIPAVLPRKLPAASRPNFRCSSSVPGPCQGRTRKVQLALSHGKPGQEKALVVTLNGKAVISDTTWQVPAEALGEGHNRIGVRNVGTLTVTIERVELSYAFLPSDPPPEPASGPQEKAKKKQEKQHASRNPGNRRVRCRGGMVRVGARGRPGGPEDAARPTGQGGHDRHRLRRRPGRKLQLAIEHLKTAGAKGVDIACLPEEFAGTTAEPIPGPTTNAVAELARKHQHVRRSARSASRPTMGNSTTRPCSWIVKGKVAGCYRKVFVFWGEGLNVSEEGVKVFDTDFGRIAILTCFDANFDEVWQEAERQGRGDRLLAQRLRRRDAR